MLGDGLLPLSRFAGKARRSVLRRSGYEMASHVPEEWTRWLRSRNVLANLLKRLSINCIFDVGANQGQFGQMLRQMRFKGTIFSFEPVQSNFAILQKVAAAAEPWRVFPYALGSYNGYQEIHVTESTVFSSFLPSIEESRNRFPGNRVVRTESVEIRRLDSVFDGCLEGFPSPRIFLKLDTQGFDLEVLRGAESILDRVLGLQTEMSLRPIYQGMPDFETSIREFKACGFEVVDFVPVTLEGDEMRAIEMDCMMVRK